MSKLFNLEETYSRLKTDIPKILDRDMIRAGSEKRKLREPRCEDTHGKVRGVWSGSTFIPDDSYVPTACNKERLTVGEIKEKLRQEYNFQFEGIPFKYGSADFSGISLAHISTADLVSRIEGIPAADYASMSADEKAKLLERVFGRKELRTRNFRIAAEITAERGVPIPGLPEHYTAEDLMEWAKGRCSWDEQLVTGYNLVPSVIHQNISHTGLVSVSGKAHSFLKERVRQMKEHPELYAWNDKDAPIHYKELKNCTLYKRRKTKGVPTMPRNHFKIDGPIIDPKGPVDSPSDTPAENLEQMKDEIKSSLGELDTLQEMGQGYKEDMDLLDAKEEEIKNNDRLLPENKESLCKEIQEVKKKVRELYKTNVNKKQIELTNQINSKLKAIQSAVKALEEERKVLQQVRLVQSGGELKDAAAVADKQAKDLNDYAEATNKEFLEDLANLKELNDAILNDLSDDL